MIESITTYRFDGRDFRSLKDVRTYVEDEIGKIIDSAQPVRLTPAQALAVLEAVTRNHSHLVELLTATIETDEEDLNILDAEL